MTYASTAVDGDHTVPREVFGRSRSLRRRRARDLDASDGRWEPFAMILSEISAFSVAAILGAFTIGACGSSSDNGAAKTCASGQSVACTGPGGCSGGQACKADGSGYEACVCGVGGGDGGSDGGTGSDSASDGSGGDAAAETGSALTIKSIRQNQPTVGTMVSLKDVVVVGHVTSSKYGHVWVQDQGGGAYSGIHLVCNYGGTSPNCAMTRMQIDQLAAGDVVTVTGKFTLFVPTMPVGAPSQLELDAPTITKAGQTVAPVAMTVAASAVAKDQFGASSDPYKGAYVKVAAGGPYPVSNVMATEFQASCTSSTMVMGTTYSGFEVTNGTNTLAVGMGFYNTISYCIPACGYPCVNQVTNQSFTSIAGIVEPTVGNGTIYLGISPVADADVPHS